MARLIRSTLLTLIAVSFFCFTNSTSAQDWTQYHYKGGNICDGYVPPDNTNELILFSYHYLERFMLRSHDGGDSLVLDDNYPEFALSELAVCMSRPDSLYVLGRTDDTRTLLFSQDQGQSFEDRTPTEFTLNSSILATSWSNPDLIGLLNGEELLISRDAGENWAQYNNIPEDAETIYFHPTQDSTWYIMSSNSGFYDDLFITRDFGETWAEHDSIPEYSDDFLLGRDLVIDVQNPEIIYCNALDAMEFYSCGIAKSIDGGEHWALMENPINITGFDYDGSMLIVDGNNLYSSYDSGTTLVSRLAEGGFLPLDGYEPYQEPTMIMTYKESQDTLWVCRSDNLFRTDNRGVTWEIVGEGFNRQNFETIQLNPHNNNQILLFGSEANFWTVNKDGSDLILTSMSKIDGFQLSTVSPDTMLRYSRGILVEDQKRLELSTDGGTTWEDLDSNLPITSEEGGLIKAAMLDSNPDILFIIIGAFWGSDYTGCAYFTSDDRGLTWERITQFSEDGSFYPDLYNPDCMYISNNSNIYRYDLNDDSYSIVNPQLSWMQGVHPQTGAILGGTGQNYVVVSENGESMSQIDMPTENTLRTCIFHPGIPSGILISTVNNEIYYTPDFGVNWISYSMPEDRVNISRGYMTMDGAGNLFLTDYYEGLWMAEGVILGVNDSNKSIPYSFELLSPYPNPFNSTVQVPFNMAHQGLVRFTVYDMLGREVTRIARTVETAGKQTISWNTSGKNIASGTYILQMETETFKSSKKIQLIK